MLWYYRIFQRSTQHLLLLGMTGLFSFSPPPPKHHARSRNTKTTTTTPFPRSFHFSLFSLDVFLFLIIFVHASSTSRRQTLPTDGREIAGKLANRYNLCMRVHERAYWEVSLEDHKLILGLSHSRVNPESIAAISSKATLVSLARLLARFFLYACEVKCSENYVSKNPRGCYLFLLPALLL